VSSFLGHRGSRRTPAPLLEHDCQRVLSSYLFHRLQRSFNPSDPDCRETDYIETLEAAIIVSVLLSFIKNAIGDDELALRKRLIKQVPPLLLSVNFNS